LGAKVIVGIALLEYRGEHREKGISGDLFHLSEREPENNDYILLT
jgi:hypothetical protein